MNFLRILLLHVAITGRTNHVVAFAPPPHGSTSRHYSSSRTTTTTHNMAFELPESVIETISTQDLIDNILDECLRMSARRPIMRQFDPASKSIWKQWKGTVVAETWQSGLRHVIWAMGVYLVFKQHPTISKGFVGFNRIWGEVLAVTTFTLTFFVNESYSCWRTCLNICYTLQARMNDFSIAMAGCAKRTEPTDPEGTSTFTPASRKTLLVLSRYIRLFNILCYASFTRSHRPLLTRQGMRRLVARGLMTEKEQTILTNSNIAATSRHNAVLMWMFRTALDARKAGHFDGETGFEHNVLVRIQEIRGQGNYMECILKGRMPFAYAHIVQVLVDAVLWSYPVMAFSSGMSFQLGVLGTFVLTMCYQGLFDLSKRFLDPFHNESFNKGNDPIVIDTLIAETNAGSLRWMYGLEEMPIPFKKLQDGDLDEFILPNDGFTIEEAALEEEKQEEALAKETAAATASSVTVTDAEAQVEEDFVDYEEEFEETMAILNTPPGYDFVPGLDDDAELNNDAVIGMMEDDQYLEIATEEYEEARDEFRDTLSPDTLLPLP